ncbi:MAG: type II CAAX endopeptidase family protein [Chloroflexota bacterium]|nr:CPBP family intramembrane metalloprotease [Dehalococcoidia bacterium]MDW8255048.1 type II CAAX endopeptidase family protein [Chloroflexota bacterium]
MTETAVPTGSAPLAQADRLDWKDLAIALGVLAAMVGVLAGLIVAVSLSGVVTPAAFEDGSILPALIGFQTLAFTLAALAPLLRHRRAGPGLLGVRRVNGRWLLAAVALGAATRGLVLLALLAVTAAGIDVGNPQQELLAATRGAWPSFLLLILTGAVLTAVGEELLFRGLLFGWLRTHLPFWPAAAGSALVFGIFHGVNVVLPVAVAIGVLCAALYERTRSIWPPVLVHLTNNLLVFVTARLFAGGA